MGLKQTPNGVKTNALTAFDLSHPVVGRLSSLFSINIVENEP